MYEFNRIFQDFNDRELAEGTEKLLLGSLKLSKNKIKRDNESILELTAPMPSGEEDQFSWDSRESRVKLSEEYGELISCKCGCQSFQKDSYTCGHTTGLLLAYLAKRDGMAVLEGSRLNEILEKKTGVERPFRKNALRPTDKALSDLLLLPAGGKKELSLKKQGTFHAECFLNEEEEENRLYVDLRVGEKRLYVLKNIRSFFEAYEKQREMTFGKNDPVRISPALFTEEARIKTDFLFHIFREADAQLGRYLSGEERQERMLMLCASEIDAFMETVGVLGLHFRDAEKELYYFSAEEQELPALLQKEEFGATLTMNPIRILTKSLKYVYYVQGNKICRFSLETDARIFSMLRLLQEKKELYIRNSEIPTFCRTMLPAICEVLTVDHPGLKLEDYLPEVPKFELYLDMPQDDMISCQAYAVYKDGKAGLFCAGPEDGQKDAEAVSPDKRNREAEEEAEEAIRSLFNSFDPVEKTMYYQGGEKELFEFLTDEIPKLEQIGDVYVSDKMNKLRVVRLNRVAVGVSVESGLMRMNMKSDSLTPKELAEVLSAYSRKKKYHRLKNGTFIAFDGEQEPVWSALADCMQYLNKKDPENLSLPLYRAMYLDEALKEKEGIQYNKTREYRKLVKEMKTAQDGDYEVPESLESILRVYQKDGFRWLKTLKDNGFGGILADDMGLGKTLQVLAFLLSEKEEGKHGEALRTLIVTPASLVYNWKREIERYTPELSARTITGTAAERKRILAQAAAGDETDIWITSYDLLKRDIDSYEGIVFGNQIIDEAQYIKNQSTNAAVSVRRIESSFRAALTGTPIENRLSELWSIFDYLMPGFLYSYHKFRTVFELPIVSEKDEEVMEKLRKMIHPFILRRMKKEVLRELPEKQEEVVSVELTGEQRKLYDAHVQRLMLYMQEKSDEELHQSKLEILAELTKLRQLCCGPELMFEDYQGENAKLDTCMELISQAISSGHKILLFSQFTTMLDRIGKRLDREEIAYYRIDGSVSKEERMRQVDAFQSPEDPVAVFCISLKAGGTGLNLTAADIVIHYDPWWNLAAQNQATDRAHRIGQTRALNVYQLIAADTIEQRIRELQESKSKLAQDVLDGDSISSIRIDRNEILKLLEENGTEGC